MNPIGQSSYHSSTSQRQAQAQAQGQYDHRTHRQSPFSHDEYGSSTNPNPIAGSTNGIGNGNNNGNGFGHGFVHSPEQSHMEQDDIDRSGEESGEEIGTSNLNRDENASGNHPMNARASYSASSRQDLVTPAVTASSTTAAVQKRKRSIAEVGGQGGKGKTKAMNVSSSLANAIGGVTSTTGSTTVPNPTGGSSTTTTKFNPSKEKRKRQVQSCSECRRRKIKCDKKFPCGPCVLRNDQSICREVEKHSPTSTGCASSQDVLQIQYRLAALESVLAHAGILTPGALDDMLGSRGKLNLPVGELLNDSPADLQGAQNRLKRLTRGIGLGNGHGVGIGSISNHSILNDDGEIDSDTEGAAMTLEDLAFGRRKVNGDYRNGGVVGFVGMSDENQGGGGNRGLSSLDVTGITGGATGGRTRENFGELERSGTGESLNIGLGNHSNIHSGNSSPSVIMSRQNTQTQMNDPPFPLGPAAGSDSIFPTTTTNQTKTKTEPTEQQGGGIGGGEPHERPIYPEDALNGLEPTQVFSIFYQRNDVYVKALLSVLPGKEVGELLVTRVSCGSSVVGFIYSLFPG